MNKKICLKDIAEKVGVSTALVSYVLNDKKVGRIKPSVAERIKAVALELNYRTNQIAKSLKTNKTNTIGLIVADLANPFSSNLARIIENEADKENYTVLFGSSDENMQRTDKLVATFLDRQVDGLIIAPGEHALPQLELLQRQRIPFVLIDRYFPAINANYVALDNYKASCLAVQHLVNAGFKRIGMITMHTNLFNIKERDRGYVETLTRNGIAFEPGWLKPIGTDHIKTNVKAAMADLLQQDEPIEALLFATNAIATHGLKYLNELGVKVPDQLALVSFDKTDALDLFYAPLTYINQPIAEMGRMATRILVETINGSTDIIQRNLPAELVIRSSSVVYKNDPASI